MDKQPDGFSAIYIFIAMLIAIAMYIAGGFASEERIKGMTLEEARQVYGLESRYTKEGVAR